MPTFYTRRGDDGMTGLLGEGRVNKYDLRMDTLGAIDEATAALGLARAQSVLEITQELTVTIQRDLYRLMAETAATQENAERFHAINAEKIEWLETEIDALSQRVDVPREFIIPGDTVAGAAFDVARTIVRRAERFMAALLARGDVHNTELLKYLNRLSSLLFILELFENQSAGKNRVTLAKGENGNPD